MVIMTCVTIMHTRHTCQATVVLRQRLFIYLFLDTVVTSATTANFEVINCARVVGIFGWGIQIHTTLKFLSDNVAAPCMHL